jgi:hypothetical protein
VDTYIGTKIVMGEPETKDGRDGYAVVYDDGYRSWSPKDVFERCYRHVTDAEASLLRLLVQARIAAWASRASRHSNDRGNEIMDALGQPLGATKRFPLGKLTPHDEGEIRIAIGTSAGKVVMDFGNTTAWIGFDKAQALEIAETLRKHAETL